MNDDPAPAIDIVEEHGSFLLIRAGSRFAVVERRGRIYPTRPGEREGEDLPRSAATIRFARLAAGGTWTRTFGSARDRTTVGVCKSAPNRDPAETGLTT